MAHDKRKRKLGGSLGPALTALDRAIHENIQTPLDPVNEFTARQLWDQLKASDPKLSLESVRFRLARQARRGELLSRTIKVGGNYVAVFSYPPTDKESL